MERSLIFYITLLTALTIQFYTLQVEGRRPHRFGHANANTNINTNINTRRNAPPPAPLTDEEKMSEQIVQRIAETAAATAADAAKVVTNSLINELSETTADAVAEAVLRVFIDDSPDFPNPLNVATRAAATAIYRRKNVNSNTNVNLLSDSAGSKADNELGGNVAGRDYDYEGADPVSNRGDDADHINSHANSNSNININTNLRSRPKYYKKRFY